MNLTMSRFLIFLLLINFSCANFPIVFRSEKPPNTQESGSNGLTDDIQSNLQKVISLRPLFNLSRIIGVTGGLVTVTLAFIEFLESVMIQICSVYECSAIFYVNS